MKVLKFELKEVAGSVHLYSLEASVVEKSFKWVVENQAYIIPDDVDPGPIDADLIPSPLSETWGFYGRHGMHSKVIPRHIDLDSHEKANTSIRTFGTLNMVEDINREDFDIESDGVLAYMQLLMKTKYIPRLSDLDRDLVPIAKKVTKEWNEEVINRFTSNVLMKSESNISLADIAHVVEKLSGKTIDLPEEDFNTLRVANYLSIDKAAQEAPDEFFSAVFPAELMEIEILKELLITADGGLYFCEQLEFPRDWKLSGPNRVKWRLRIGEGDVSWATMAGTMITDALKSKEVLFPDLDGDIPFSTPVEQLKIVDERKMFCEPGSFVTGIRYLAGNREMEILKISISRQSYHEISKEISTWQGGKYSKVDADRDSIVESLEEIYLDNEAGIEEFIKDRHFIVLTGGLPEISDQKSEYDLRYYEDSSEVVRLGTYVFPGEPGWLRDFLLMTWVVKHMESDSICYSKADNADFTVRSLIEYLVPSDSGLSLPSVILVNCAYSKKVSKRQSKLRDAELDFSPAFDLK